MFLLQQKVKGHKSFFIVCSKVKFFYWVSLFNPEISLYPLFLRACWKMGAVSSKSFSLEELPLRRGLTFSGMFLYHFGDGYSVFGHIAIIYIYINLFRNTI